MIFKQYRVVLVFIIMFIFLPSVVFAAGDYSQNKDGVSVWFAYKLRNTESFIWDGSVYGGYAEGDGVLKWYEDGKLVLTYTGSMHLGKNTKGSIAFADGSKYIGDCAEGFIPSGKGLYIIYNGQQYEGGFKNGVIEGEGIYYNAKGNIVGKGVSKNGVFQSSIVKNNSVLEDENNLKQEMNDVTWEYNDAISSLQQAARDCPLYTVGGGQIITDNGDDLYMINTSVYSLDAMMNDTGVNVKVINPDRNLIVSGQYYNPYGYGSPSNYYFVGTETGYNSLGFPVPIYVYCLDQQKLSDRNTMIKRVDEAKRNKESIEGQLKELKNIGSDPETFYLKRGRELYDRAFDTGTAYSDLTRVIAINSENDEAYILRAQLNYNKMKEDKALEDLEAAISLNTKDHRAYYLKGRIFLDHKDYKHARECFVNALNLMTPAQINSRLIFDTITAVEKESEGNQLTLETKNFLIGLYQLFLVSPEPQNSSRRPEARQRLEELKKL